MIAMLAVSIPVCAQIFLCLTGMILNGRKIAAALLDDLLDLRVAEVFRLQQVLTSLIGKTEVCGRKQLDPLQHQLIHDGRQRTLADEADTVHRLFQQKVAEIAHISLIVESIDEIKAFLLIR